MAQDRVAVHTDRTVVISAETDMFNALWQLSTIAIPGLAMPAVHNTSRDRTSC